MRGVVTAALAAAALAASAGGAAAATPCWKQVQNDWFRHGKVVGHYKLTCYTLAIKNLPADAATYGGAAQDIRKAYLAEKRRLAALKKKKH